MDMEQTARAFFEACETGGGWEACREHCTEEATFSCQADALADIATLSGYTEWMKGLLGPIPDARYTLTAFAADKERETVVAAAVFSGTHTGEGGPVAPTGRAVASDYAYVMRFENGSIVHVAKIWNDLFALRQAGWA